MKQKPLDGASAAISSTETDEYIVDMLLELARLATKNRNEVLAVSLHELWQRFRRPFRQE